MKRIIAFTFVFCLCCTPVFAADEVYQDVDARGQILTKAEYEASKNTAPAQVTREFPDYFSKTHIPLTKNEREALELAKEWSKAPTKPLKMPNGKIAFMHGASVPSVIAAPFNITDIEFEDGESISTVMLGDTARWQVDSGSVGNTPHIFFKPLDTGLETSAVVTTNKRVYHMRLVSQRKGFMPYVGFIYRDQVMAITNSKMAEQQAQTYHNSMIIGSQTINLAELDFAYKVIGKAKWKPVQVYSDGNKTYIKMPEKVQEMPILLAQHQGDVLVNYRVKNNVFVVDGTFDEIILVLGIGSAQEKITIKKA